MHYKSAIAAAIAVASFAPATLAKGVVGKAIVENKCGHDAFAQSIADRADAKMHKISPGDSYTETFKLNDNGGGISIKISDDKDLKEVSQFEYTLSDDGKVFYDLSNIDGYPFKEGGVSITPSDDSCPVVNCEGGVAKCKDAYNHPKDDHATKGCSAETDLHLVLCAGNGGSKAKSKKAEIKKETKKQPRHPHAPFNA